MSDSVEKTSRFVFRPTAAKPSNLRSYLVVREGRERGERLEIRDERQVVGRGAGASLRLSDPNVSSLHLAAWLVDGALWIEDLGSSNGTFLDDRQLSSPIELPVGAMVSLGKTLVRHEIRNPEELARESALEEDLGRAAAYVSAILPQPLAEGAVRVSWRYLPSEKLGGDVFGYRWLDDDRFLLFLLDVSGHGIQSSLHAVSIANALRSGALGGAGPGEPGAILAALNAAFPMASHGGLYLTAWYGVYDRRERRLRFSGGGHPAPLLRAAAGDDPGAGPKVELDRLVCRNPPIGMAEDLVYRVEERIVAPGSRLYLFSDGVFEIVNDEGRAWRPDDLAEIVARPSIPGLSEVARVETDVRAALAGSHFDDDFSLLVIEFD